MHSSQLRLTAKHDIAVIVTTGTKQRWKTYDMYSSESDVVILALHIEVTVNQCDRSKKKQNISLIRVVYKAKLKHLVYTTFSQLNSSYIIQRKKASYHKATRPKISENTLYTTSKGINMTRRSFCSQHSPATTWDDH